MHQQIIWVCFELFHSVHWNCYINKYIEIKNFKILLKDFGIRFLNFNLKRKTDSIVDDGNRENYWLNCWIQDDAYKIILI